MNTILLMSYFIFLMHGGRLQTNSLAGAWFWSDSDKQISMFIKKDGFVSMYVGKKGAAILMKDLKRGTISYTKTNLTITWTDNTIEQYKYKYVSNDVIELRSSSKSDFARKRKYSFTRIIDEVDSP